MILHTGVPKNAYWDVACRLSCGMNIYSTETISDYLFYKIADTCHNPGPGIVWLLADLTKEEQFMLALFYHEMYQTGDI